MQHTLVKLLVVWFGFLNAVDLRADWQLPSTVLVAGAALSAAKGVYNVRNYYQVIAQCQADYQLDYKMNLLQYPGQALQNLICVSMPAVDDRHDYYHGQCVSQITNKINLFDALDPQIIWNFDKFKNSFPHNTNIQSSYCVSKNYMGSFGYETLGMLKSAVAYQIFKVEDDFKNLINLTNLTWYHVKMPLNLDDYLVLEHQLAQCSSLCGLYALLGCCGYSPIHNGQRVQKHIASLAKIHIFLVHLQELLTTSTDSDQIELIDAQGVLHFSLHTGTQKA